MLNHGMSPISAFCVKASGQSFSGHFVLKHGVSPIRAFCVKPWGESYQGILCESMG